MLTVQPSLPLDVIIAAFSGGVLVYSAFLLVPTAQAYLTEITYESLRSWKTTHVEELFPKFPNDQLPRAVEQYVNTGVGLELLIAGTFGGIIATVVTGFSFVHADWWAQRLIAAGAAFAVGLVLSRTYHVTQQRERSNRASWYTFLVWLKYHGWAKPRENLRVVVGKAATESRFRLLEECVETNRAKGGDALWEAVLDEVLRHSRRRLVRRDNENLRQWADKIAASPRIETRG